MSKLALPKPTITAFKNSPDRGQGLARDFRVRWALEEVGQPYDVKLVTFEEMKQPSYHALQPFGQIPAYIEGDLTLFESGAIIQYIAETRDGLFPTDRVARARTIMWMFSALNTVEQPIVERSSFWLLEREKPYYGERIAMLDERCRVRLQDLSDYLGDRDWLDDVFTAGDLLMITVIRRLESSGLLKDFPIIEAYISRGVARPAYQRAFAAQLALAKAAGR